MKELLKKVDHTLLGVGCTWQEIQEICDANPEKKPILYKDYCAGAARGPTY